MSYHRQFSIIGSIITLLFVILGCQSDSPTQSNGGGVDQSSIFVSLLSVSVIPNGTETIEITALDSDGLPDTYTATSNNAAVATVTQEGSEITITGVDYGEAVITITGSGGLVRDIPVQVYNHYVLDTGELLITYVDSFELRWGPQDIGYFWHPIAPDGFHALGSLGDDQIEHPNGRCAAIVVQQEDGSDALAYPEYYDLVDYIDPLPPYIINDGSIWQPIPPSGYKAMGTVITSGNNIPSIDDVVCVREDLTIPASAGDPLAAMLTPGNTWSSWEIVPPEVGPHDYCYLHTGTFIAWEDYELPPPSHDAMNILKVDLPLLAEAPSQNYIPQLDSYNEPAEETFPTLAKVMLAPCTIVSDLLYGDNIGWRIANSPFYRLERQVYYKLLYHNYNQTSELQTNSVTIISGVTIEESQTFSEETSVSITAEAGVSFQIFEASISGTFSTTFGYETQTSISELEEIEIASSINTAPGKAAALWQKYNRFVLKRHNGTSLEPVAMWEFGIDSYTTDEYPDE
jgi:hypothetical protein